MGRILFCSSCNHLLSSHGQPNRYIRPVLDQFMLVRIRNVYVCVCVCVCVWDSPRGNTLLDVAFEGRGLTSLGEGTAGGQGPSCYSLSFTHYSRALFLPLLSYIYLPSFSLLPVSVLYLSSYSCSFASSRCSPIPTILFALSLLPPLYSPPRCLFFSSLLRVFI